jgi:hypothetical protein
MKNRSNFFDTLYLRYNISVCTVCFWFSAFAEDDCGAIVDDGNPGGAPNA